MIVQTERATFMLQFENQFYHENIKNKTKTGVEIKFYDYRNINDFLTSNITALELFKNVYYLI